MYSNGMFVAGEFCEAASGRADEIVNPATEEVCGSVPRSGEEDVDRAVQAAREAFENGRWSELGPGERAAILWRMGELVEERADELIPLEIAPSGKTLKLVGDGDVPMAADYLKYVGGSPGASGVPRRRSTCRATRHGCDASPLGSSPRSLPGTTH
jgi:acyl-CoA reductase-like NAD-dependent aldehyde dehydrogenase